jgi:nitroimidazol reductase NimA-like FMN-containing flavoprotein (pyridoxamine 5'-phosphate oxidase superfamily)
MQSEVVMRRKGPWSNDQVQRFLRDVRIPIRIATNGSSGHPVIASLWFIPEGEKLWCATQQSSSIASLLSRDPRCAFEVSVETPPYRGVRGTGLATLHDERGEEILRTLLQRYLGDTNSRIARMLLKKSAHETAIAIQPQTLVTWDYQARMEAAS